jgi:thiamine biosynthesis lipoprotein
MSMTQRSLNRRELLTGRRRVESPFWVRVHRLAMACRFEVMLPGEDVAHVPAANDALTEAGRLDALLSVFRDTSELSLVNRCAAREPVHVSAELFGLLQQCRDLHRATGGAFDVTTTPLSRCWGFIRREGRVPTATEIDDARAVVDMSSVELDESTRTVRFHRAGMELNLGSIGKGYAVQCIASALLRRGVRRALVSAGASSASVLGGRGEGWPIDVISRRAAHRRLARLRLRHGAMGTSGAGEQYIDAQGTRYGHVLDPRTGWPSQGILSVTVVTADGAAADALATAFLVGGRDLVQRYCDAHPETLALLTPEDGSERPIVIGRYDGAIVEDA